MKHLIAILSIILLFSCKAEKKDPLFAMTPDQMEEDFLLFQSIYEEANAGLYKYRKKEQVDSAFAANKAQISETTTYREFYTLLWNVIDYTGSCHNGLTYPEALDEALNKKDIFFPIPLKYIDGKLYTNYTYNGIAMGSEVLAINKMPIDEVAKRCGHFISTDGYNQTGKYTDLDSDWFAFYMYLVFGEQQQFTLQYQNKAESTSATVQSVDYITFFNNYQKRHSAAYDNRITKDYFFTYKDSIGYLNINTFAMGGPESEGHKQYATFLDSVFVALKDNHTQKLIVDVRGNGGGNDPNDLLLYSYLTDRSFRENTTAHTLFQEVPFPNYYLDDDIDELAKELKEEHSIFKDGNYYQNATFNPAWQPKPNAFTGDLVLLIDPPVASAGSLFASLVKSDDDTIVIGEETLGGYYGHTGHIPVHYELPHSKLELKFSIVDLEQDVRQLPDEQYGDGIQPDDKVVQTYPDFLTHRDTQLEFAIKKISSK
ncbi:S41 family peptidase [Aquimarina sp. AU58]|uniref:S41 family peptidase n=1 Tax=Aquimarina sp. AU58 TaxID=1874112 RepID=UPI000D65C567|nr:S41 family peptidase [Aquimarina sp. AU58]